MATLVQNPSFGPFGLPPIYGSTTIPVGGSVIIADTPANVYSKLGQPPSSVVRISQTGDGQAGAIQPTGGGGSGGSTGSHVFEVAAPVAADVVTVSSAGLAANAAGSAFTLASNPDKPRNLQVAFGSGWDGGNVTINGTDQFGKAQVEVFTASAGHTVTGVKCFATVTAAAKGTVGSSSATATIGVGNALGVDVQLANTNAVMLADNAAEPATLDTTNNTFTPTVSVPNGSVNYALIANS